jgi:hypothetical protein
MKRTIVVLSLVLCAAACSRTATPPEAASCENEEDCADGLECFVRADVHGECRPRGYCVDESDCEGLSACVDYRCTGVECTPPQAEVCGEFACIDGACAEATECAPGHACVDSKCEPQECAPLGERSLRGLRLPRRRLRDELLDGRRLRPVSRLQRGRLRSGPAPVRHRMRGKLRLRVERVLRSPGGGHEAVPVHLSTPGRRLGLRVGRRLRVRNVPLWCVCAVHGRSLRGEGLRRRGVRPARERRLRRLRGHELLLRQRVRHRVRRLRVRHGPWGGLWNLRGYDPLPEQPLHPRAYLSRLRNRRGRRLRDLLGGARVRRRRRGVCAGDPSRQSRLLLQRGGCPRVLRRMERRLAGRLRRDQLLRRRLPDLQTSPPVCTGKPGNVLLAAGAKRGGRSAEVVPRALGRSEDAACTSRAAVSLWGER